MDHEKVLKEIIARCILYIYDEDLNKEVVACAMTVNEAKTIDIVAASKIIEKTSSDVCTNLIKDILIEDFKFVKNIIKEVFPEKEDIEYIIERLREKRIITLAHYKKVKIYEDIS